MIRVPLLTKATYTVGWSFFFFFFLQWLGIAHHANDPLFLCGLKLLSAWCFKLSTGINKSFYGSPPIFSLTKSPVSKTNPGSCLLKYGVPRHPDVIDRQAFAHKKIYGYFAFNRILLCVEQPRNVRKRKSLVWGGAIVVRISPMEC